MLANGSVLGGNAGNSYEHYRTWLARVARADRLSVRSVWLSEHHGFDDGYLPQPLAFAAAVAAVT